MKTEERQSIMLTVNGQERKFFIGTDPGEIPASQTLAYTLRDNLGLTGLKIGCDDGAGGDGADVHVLSPQCCSPSATLLSEAHAVLWWVSHRTHG